MGQARAALSCIDNHVTTLDDDAPDLNASVANISHLELQCLRATKHRRMRVEQAVVWMEDLECSPSRQRMLNARETSDEMDTVGPSNNFDSANVRGVFARS